MNSCLHKYVFIEEAVCKHSLWQMQLFVACPQWSHCLNRNKCYKTKRNRSPTLQILGPLKRGFIYNWLYSTESMNGPVKGNFFFYFISVELPRILSKYLFVLFMVIPKSPMNYDIEVVRHIYLRHIYFNLYVQVFVFTYIYFC